jgi:HEAT repeat protein
MRDETKIAILLGRLLELLAKTPEPTDDHRTALQALTELLARRSAAVVLDEGAVTVEGEPAPADTPFVGTLKDRLTAHQVARLHLAHGTSAVDLVELLRALAAPPPATKPAQELEDRLERAHLVTVSIVSRERETGAKARRPMRITEAFRVAETAPAGPSGPMGVIPTTKTTAFVEMEKQQLQQRTMTGVLGQLVARLQDDNDPQPLLSRLDAVQSGIVKAIGGKDVDQALEALLRIIRLEAASANPEIQRAYGIALRRLLTTEHLRKFAPLAFDEMYHEDIVLLMRRAGKAGTKVLLDLLIEAPSQAERRAYLRALRQMEEGADVVASLLNHHEWFVVRNAADLVGELKLTEAVPALAKVVGHADARVRRSVGIALARIGIAETALPLRKLLGDTDPQVRLAVVKEVGGRGMSGLAMPIVSAAGAEQEPGVLAEYYRALGRIGTPDAVQALVKAAHEAGSLLSRKPQGPRLAAIEALGTAGGPIAIAVLKELMENRSGEVRATAAGALERATTGAGG